MKTPVTQYIRTCARCGKPSPQLGGGIRVISSIRQWVCKGCKAAIDRLKNKVAA